MATDGNERSLQKIVDHVTSKTNPVLFTKVFDKSKLYFQGFDQIVEHTERADSNQRSVQCSRKGGVGDDPNAS